MAPLFSSFRLKKVELWSQPLPAGNGSTIPTQNVRFEWKGDNVPDVVLADTSNGIEPAHVVAFPPRNSSATWWYHRGGTAKDLFQVTELPVGGILDVEVEYVLEDNVSAPFASTVTGAAGAIVQVSPPLGAGSNLTPVGYVPYH